MSELGALLRQSRESQGLSLAQAAADTRILLQSLIALEEGAYQRLPSDVVIRGFIRNYAQYLGLSADDLIELYRRERGSTDKIRIIPATNPPRGRSYVLPSFFGVFFVTAALVGLAYVLLSAAGQIGDRAAAIESAPLTPSVPPPSPLPTSSPGRVPTIALPVAAATPPPRVPTAGVAGGVASSDALPSPSPAAPIIVEVSVPNRRGAENSWVRIQSDGNTIFEGIMRAGDRRLIEAQRRVLIRAGNPTDVQVTVNGLQQGSLGQVSGQPVNWSWPPN